MSTVNFLKNIESGETIELVKSPFTIGRTLSSDYVIAHTVISKKQCTLERSSEGWILSDTSTNGTMVNKVLLKKESVPLKNLDEICFGFHTYTYQFFTSPTETKCSQVEKLKSQEKVARFSPPNSPNSFDEHGVSDDILNALADEILHNIENNLEESKEETSNHCVKTDSIPKDRAIEPPSKSSGSLPPINEDKLVNTVSRPNVDVKLTGTPSQSLNLNRILDPMGLMMRSVSSNNINIETVDIEKLKPPDVLDTDVSQSSSGTIIYSPSEILPAQPLMPTNILEHSHKQNSDGSSQDTNSLRSEISSVLNLIAGKTPDLVNPLANSSSVNFNGQNSISNHSAVPDNQDPFRQFYNATNKSNVSVEQLKADCQHNLLNTANKYSADINTFVSKNSEESASSLLMQLANDGKDITPSQTVILNSDPGTSKITISQTYNPRTAPVIVEKQFRPAIFTKGVISPANVNKKLKVSYATENLVDITGPLKNPTQHIVDLSKTSESVVGFVTPQNVENAVKIQGSVKSQTLLGRKVIIRPTSTSVRSESSSLPPLDIIDLTNSQDINGNVDNSLPNTGISSTSNLPPVLNKETTTSTDVITNTEQPGSAVITETRLGCDIKIFESEALPVAHNEVVTTSKPSTADFPTLSRSTEQAPSVIANTLQEPGPSKKDDALKHNNDEKETLNHKNSYEEMENELLCAICANFYIKTVTLSCSHSFCEYCIEQWKKKKSDCPVCRTKISSTIRTLVLDNIIEKIMESAPTDERTQRQEAVQERENIEKAKKGAQQQSRRPQTARTGRRGGNTGNEGNLTNSNNPQQQQAPTVELSDQSSESSSSSSSVLSDSELSQSEYDYDEYNHDDWYDDDDDYNGVPGAYYGGYGRCYRCGDPGHWANGCPN